MKNLARDEKGAALILALILLLIGGLLSAALLGHMGSGILAGEVHERRTAELYAADAGVEDAIWKITHNYSISYPYHYPDPLIMNGKSVDIVIYREDLDPTCGEDFRYRILATAMTEDGGGVASIPSTTTVEAYLRATYMDFSSLLDNAIVSDNDITIYNGVSVTGNVTSGGSVTILGDGSDEDVDGTVTRNADLDWPTAEDLSAYYLSQVKDGMIYYGDTLLDLEGNSCPPGPIYKTTDKVREAVDWSDGLGPLKVNGTLDVTSSGNHEVVTLRLNDTLYITGDTKIYGPSANEPYKLNIDLNGQAIFVESGNPDSNYALEVKDCTIVGSGCIIAVGDLYFAPKGDVGGENDFVLVMSIEGTTTLQPSGTFYGCIAGNLAVDARSGEDATIINSGLAEGQELNFPMGADGGDELPSIDVVNIESWEIEQH